MKMTWIKMNNNLKTFSEKFFSVLIDDVRIYNRDASNQSDLTHGMHETPGLDRAVNSMNSDRFAEFATCTR